jgi:hypothetical protein
MKTEIKIGDRIKSIEDGDCYYVGIVTSIKGNPTYDDGYPELEMLVEQVIWGDEELFDDEQIGTIMDTHWFVEQII